MTREQQGWHNNVQVHIEDDKTWIIAWTMSGFVWHGTHMWTRLFCFTCPQTEAKGEIEGCRDRIFLGLSHFILTSESLARAETCFPNSLINNSLSLFHSHPFISPSPSFSFPTTYCFHFIYMIMKFSHILLFCVLATASYVFYQHFSIASLNFLPGRRHVRELSMSFSNPKHEYQKIQVAPSLTLPTSQLSLLQITTL